MIKRLIVVVNLLISGLIAFMVTMFFATGTIAENYTDKTFVAPGYFAILVIWGTGAILAFVLLFKYSKRLLYTALIFMWGSLPGGFMIESFLSL